MRSKWLYAILMTVAAVALPAGAIADQASDPLSPAAGKLDAGASFTCAIITGDQVRCWGYGAEGELGYPGVTTVGVSDTPASVGPVNLGAGRTAVAISSGDFHTCAILDDGSVRCWGYGANGRLGYGNQSNVGQSQTPGSVGPVDLGGHSATAISAGGAHTCAILDDRTVRCWGYGGYGQLGYGSTSDVLSPSSVPVNLGPGRTAVAISAGARHTCAILDSGSVLCWGDASNGQLGYGNTNPVTDPGSGTPLDAVACPSPSQCTAVDSPGRQVTFNPTPAGNPTLTTVDSLNKLSSVACPLASQCTAVDGLGQQVTFNPTVPTTPAPTTVDSSAGLTAVACSSASQCTAVDASGQQVTFDPTAPGTPTPTTIDTGNSLTGLACPTTGQCTAVDTSGQQVTFKPTAPGTPTPTTIDTGNSLTGLACPSPSQCTAIDGSGQQVTFKPTAPGTPTPTPVDSGNFLVGLACPTTSLCTAVDYAGNEVTFNPNNTVSRTVATVDSGNAVAGLACPSATQCTAVDDFGQQVTFNPAAPGAPTPTTIDTVGPVDLGPGHTARAISAGANHTCAILDDGSVRCWGYGSDGELGYGNRAMIGDDETPASAGPVDVGAGRTALAISAGANHTCAILDDSSVRCWGLGVDGRLGYGGKSNVGDYQTPGSVGPVDLGAESTATAISAGGRHTCAVLGNASVRCWGYGANGQLGYCSQNDVGVTQTPGSVPPVNLQPGDGGALCPGPPASGAAGGPLGSGGPAINPDTARARGYRLCLAALATRSQHERALTHRGSARQRARARQRLAHELSSGRRRCVKIYGRTPGQVTGLHALARAGTRIELDFNASGTNGHSGPPALTYVVKQSRRPIRNHHDFATGRALCHGTCSFDVTSVGAKITLTVTALHPHTTYYYAAVALDNVTRTPGPRSPTVKVSTG